MVRRKLVIWAGFGIALCVLAALANAAQTRQTIKPGQSIGSIPIGMPRADVWKHLGKPTEIHFFQTAGQSYTWDTWREEDNTERMTVTSRRGRIVQVERHVTDEERRNYVFASVHKKHPNLTARLYNFRDEVGSVVLIDDTQQGIAWSLALLHFEGDHKMDVFNAVGPDKIIIHRRGHAALPDVGEDLDKHSPLLNNFRAWCSAKSER